MKKRKGFVKGFALLVALGLWLTGCGSAKYTESAAMDTAASAGAYDAGGTYANGAGYLSDGIYSSAQAEAAEEAPMEDEAAPAEEGDGASSDSPEVQDTSRKLIRNVNLDVETETFDELMKSVQERINSLGGYIEESFTYNGSSYYGQDRRNASLTIRIPADKLDAFLSDVAEISNVIRKNESVTDVTLQYVDMESHKKVLLTEQERLIELLGQAENIEDIIALEGRLSEVRYQIESMESQLRTLDNQVSYSTVYLNIEEVKKLTPVKEQSVWERISTGFVNSLYDVGRGLENFVVGVLIDLPYLILWALIILLAVLVLRVIIRRIKRKRDGTGIQEKKERKGRFWQKRKQEFTEESVDEETDGSEGK